MYTCVELGWGEWGLVDEQMIGQTPERKRQKVWDKDRRGEW